MLGAEHSNYLSIGHLASLSGNSLEVDAADVAPSAAADAAAPPSSDAVRSLGLVELALEDGEQAAYSGERNRIAKLASRLLLVRNHPCSPV